MPALEGGGCQHRGLCVAPSPMQALRGHSQHTATACWDMESPSQQWSRAVAEPYNR